MNYNKKAKALGKKIKNAFKEFGAEINIIGVKFISSLLRYIFEISIAPGTKIQTILDRAEDVQIALGIPFFYLFKDGININIAVSEYEIKENSLLNILRSPIFTENNMQMPYAIGYDIWGSPNVVDLAKLHHLLIAGPTGTGKSVALKCIILSTIVGCPVSRVNLLIFDIGANSLAQFDNLPHLSHPIIKDTKKGIKVLTALVKHMDELLALDETELEDYPFIVCIIDEFVSMISNADKQVAQILVNLINNLLRRGRKAKIIMILATQDPTLKNSKVDLSMIINRIAFQSTHHYNSSTALGIAGAEKLPGNGAMLFKTSKGVQFLQGSYIAPEEITAILNNPPTDYDDSNKFAIYESESEQQQPLSDIVFFGNSPLKRDTKELANIILWVVGRDTVSVNQLQKQFRMGNRANAIIEELFQLGIVGEKFSNQPREVLPKKAKDLSPDALRILRENGIIIDSLTAAKEDEDTDSSMKEQRF